MGGLFWIIWVVLKCNNRCLYKREAVGYVTQRKQCNTSGFEDKGPRGKECKNDALEDGKRKRTETQQELPREYLDF